MGLTKDKWPHITSELVRDFLDNPQSLDDDQELNPDFVERFYYYYDWYWTNQRSK